MCYYYSSNIWQYFSDIVEAVSNFIQSTNPPLQQVVQYQSTFSDAPPKYDEKNRTGKVKLMWSSEPQQ